jgi:hypothetical protein
MAIVFCEDCGEKVSTDATACPHCGRPREQAKPAKGWISAFVTNFAVISGILTLLGGVIAYFHQRQVELDQRKDELGRLALSQKAETRQSKRAFLDLQLDTYRSVLANLADINTIYTIRELAKVAPTVKLDPSVSYDHAIRTFISDYDARMAFVEDRRTEIVMQMINIAVQAPQYPHGLPKFDPRQCSTHAVMPVLAHCMKLSIATSWDFPERDQKQDDYCNLEQVAPLAEACAVPLSSQARDEFQAITATNYRSQKEIALPQAP